MRKLIITPLVFLLAGISASYARGGMHGGGVHGGGMHGGGMQGLMAPANPTVPPSLTPMTCGSSWSTARSWYGTARAGPVCRVACGSPSAPATTTIASSPLSERS